METDLKEVHTEGMCQMDLVAKIDPMQRPTPSSNTDISHTGFFKIDLDQRTRERIHRTRDTKHFLHRCTKSE